MISYPRVPHVSIGTHFPFSFLGSCISGGLCPLEAVGVWGAGYMSYVSASSSLGTLGELGALCPLMEFGRGWLAAEIYSGTCWGMGLRESWQVSGTNSLANFHDRL